MKQNKLLQSGRSMVEMLGTLAIIGVLSISGIASYSYGMDKYRANETVNDIILRAVDLMTQASRGREVLSLDEWTKESSVYDFSNPAYSDDELGLIMFDVGANNKIPQRVCEMIYDGLSNSTIQIDINERVSDSKNDCASDNTMTFYFEGGGSGTTDTGEAGKQCGSTVCGTCQKCDSATETCVTVSDYEQKCTTDDNKTGWCVGETCQAETCNCGEKQYCADTNDSAEWPTPSGLCVNVDFEELTVNGKTYYLSKDKMSWWDAQSACQTLPYNGMISTHDLVIGWDGSTFATDFDINSLTSLGQALHNKWAGRWVWTREISNSMGLNVYLDTVSGIYLDRRNKDHYMASSHLYMVVCK
ncbi:MAG: hypothetical protein IJV75_02880 [Alphaproteobacteria bacterium]|nr:hypothetical protein [Alphaproteobacteria bacterium]